MSNIEQTLSIIKPDAVERNLAPCVVDYATLLVLSIAVLEIFQKKTGWPKFY